MTDLEQRAMNALLPIAFNPHSWHRMRAHALYRVYLSDPLWKLTEHEQNDLWFLMWTYRRQVRDTELVAHANEQVNGAMSLRF
jgi:hypothetical protein